MTQHLRTLQHELELPRSAPLTTLTQVRNLDERVKIPKLMEALQSTFEACGTIVEIIAKKNIKAKGQAFVVFESVDEAEDAIDTLQDFVLFDKPMQLAYAKTRSDATVVKEDGVEGLETHKKHRLAEKGERIHHTTSVYILTNPRAQTSPRSGQRQTHQTCRSRHPRRTARQSQQTRQQRRPRTRRIPSS